MYGIVNKAIVELIHTRFGEDTWERIRGRAGLEEELFISLDAYPDEYTYALVRATSEELGLPAEQVLETFGEYWVEYVGTQGYGELLRGAGNNVQEVLLNLDNLHTRVGLSFAHLRPPSFHCTVLGPGELRLRYTSTRQGLAPMVVGLLKGLGRMFHTELHVVQTRHKEGAGTADEFLIRLQPASSS
jgi:hypothetical protein